VLNTNAVLDQDNTRVWVVLEKRLNGLGVILPVGEGLGGDDDVVPFDSRGSGGGDVGVCGDWVEEVVAEGVGLKSDGVVGGDDGVVV